MGAIERILTIATLTVTPVANPACARAPTGWGASSGSDQGPAEDGGAFGPSGGRLDAIRFAIVGDTRPAVEDDTAGYPTPVIDRIYDAIAAASPRIPFVVSTGDYVFASPQGSQAVPQLALYMAARAKYPGVFFAAMGNHECTGWTASNCGPTGGDGVTVNYASFIEAMLSPIRQTRPYYAVGIGSSAGTWNAKLVFVAANAWDNAQASWLASTLSIATTYTFVIRHESSDVTDAPGVGPSDSILASYPYTMLIVGHSHSYYWQNMRQVVVGNGGAPLTDNVDYGFGVVSQRDDGNVDVDMIDYRTLATDPRFHAVLTPAGNRAP